MLDKQMDLKTPDFVAVPRRALLVFVYSLRQIRQLKKYGTVLYVSKRMKYVVLYLDEADFDKVEEQVAKLHFVRAVERSYRPDIEMNFGEKVGTDAAFDEGEELYETNENPPEIQLIDTP